MVATEDDRAELDAAMNALGAQYQTDMHEGMAWAWRALSPRWRGDWDDPEFPKDYDDKWRKVAIIVTDGWSSPWMAPYNESVHDQVLPNVCEDMKAEYGLGNIFTSTLKELWYSDKHVEIVGDLLSGHREKYSLYA